ncbi:divergent protein kinase domain 2A [Strongylocentrotus purpuratus]|uniref:FAM69 protein-kinase domain-containing protein n=1 Tax=Strongylocentrotus purpuratus TaxID=7668 RepID=A0A7M7NNU3_STRPU|nr:divergent protein kinase domain 2A [Strongylocentrotus purpuratus]|eukprot:XP_782541.3 PREDICTED: deleted in autism protein 1 homolog [Strongylocentrotus purpuratus]
MAKMATMRRYFNQFTNRFCISTTQQLIWLVVLSSMCLFVYYQLYLHFTANHLENEYFTEATKCPACFGTSLCKRFSRGDYRFHSYSSIRLFDYVNVKNVYFATYLDQKPVVMKKLGHNSEHNQFDKDLCTNAESGLRGCDVSQQIYKSKLSDIMYAERLEEKDVMGLSDIVRCPSRRLLDRIWDTFGERQFDKSLARDHKLMLATTIAFNPEPLILQAFPNRKGWPFPAYMGACGRFTVQEYSGHSLSYFYKFKFGVRAALAVQALKIAEQLSENRDEFALYLTDVSEDNLAVNDNGEVLVIDAENIIVVDRKKIKEDANPGWDVKHQSEHEGCGSRRECIMFSHTDLCNHYYSDHNYYAVCQGLFGKDSPHGDGGLLHSIPSDLSSYMRAKVKGQIAECRSPSKRDGRYLVVKELKETLMKLIT